MINKKSFVKKHIYSILSLLFLFVLVFSFFSKLFFPHLSAFVTPDFGQSDLLHGYYPIKFVLAESLKQNVLPVWSSDMVNGYPLLADGQIGTFFIFNLILFKIVPFFWAINLSYITIFLTGGVGIYLLAGEYKLSKLLRLLAATIFILSGFNISQISHLSLVQSASLLPIELFLVEKSLKKKNVIIFGILSIIISQQIFAGHQEITTYSLVSIVLYGFCRIIFKKRKDVVISLLVFLLLVTACIVVALLLSAVQIIPSAELFASSTFQNNSQYFPYPFSNLIMFVFPFFFGSPQNGTYPPFNATWGIFWENNGYVGILPILLLPSLFFIKKNKNAVSLFSLFVISLFLVLGKNFLLFFIFEFPPFSFFRVPSRFLLLTDIALALLTSIILADITKKLSHMKQTIVFMVLIALHVINIFFLFYTFHPVADVNNWFDSKTAKYLLKDTSDYRIYSINSSDDWNRIFLKEGWQDVDKYKPLNNGLIGHSNLLYDISKSNSVVKFTTPGAAFYAQLPLLIEENNTLLIATQAAKLSGLSNIKYFILPKFLPIQNFTKALSTNEYVIYKNPYLLPRSFMLYETINTSHIEDITSYLFSPQFDPAKQVLIEDKKFEINMPGYNSPVKNKITWVKNDNTNIVLKVYTEKKGVLLLADTNYPGWKSFIDNKQVKIHTADYNFKAIVLEKGEHTVQFYYDPLSIKIGFILSLLSYGLLTCVIIFFIKKK